MVIGRRSRRVRGPVADGAWPPHTRYDSWGGGRLSHSVLEKKLNASHMYVRIKLHIRLTFMSNQNTEL